MSTPFVLLTAPIVALLALTATPAHACRGPQFNRTVHPVMAQEPAADTIPEAMRAYRIRWSGERAGRQDRLWPNYYVVEVIEGPMDTPRALIPAWVTSCHEVLLEDGATGWITAEVLDDPAGGPTPYPVLNVGMTGRVEETWPSPAR